MATFNIIAYNNLDTEGPYTFDTLKVIGGCRDRSEFTNDKEGWAFYQYLKSVCAEHGYILKSYSYGSEKGTYDLVVWRDESNVERMHALNQHAIVDALRLLRS